MSNNQVWLIDYKQTLQPFSENNEDGSTYLVATAVVQSETLIDAIKTLENKLEAEGEQLLDFWNCERYSPHSKKIQDVVKNVRINGNIYNNEDRNNAINIVLSAAIDSGNKVSEINSMSSTFLDDIGEGQWNDK